MNDASKGQHEAGGIIAAPLIETERLLVKVTEQMERFDGYVGATDGTLQERPEVFARVVNLPIDVRLGVVDDVMGVGVAQALIRQMGIGVDDRAFGNVLVDDGTEVSALPPSTTCNRIWLRPSFP